MYYLQCELILNHRSHVAWIPEEFAKHEKVLKIKDSSGIWNNGWVVKSIGIYRLKHEYLPQTNKSIRQHRKHTGDALIN